MLTIRKEQMQALAEDLRRSFRSKLARNLRADLPQETQSLSEKQLAAIIDEGLLRAARYQITTERALFLFVYLMVLHSSRFDEAPDMLWARKILLRSDLTGEARMSLIYQTLGARQRQKKPS